MNILRRVQTRYILHRHAIKHHIWKNVSRQTALLHDMSSVEKTHLRELATLFLYYKNIVGINIRINSQMRIMIATLACIPILSLGMELLDGWQDVIIYPDAFYVSREEMDEYGIVHRNNRILSGESWSKGPVILSWQDIETDLQTQRRGHNVVIHEIAHKLDMLNGRANGMPPLHTSMRIKQWTQAFSMAYRQLNRVLEQHLPAPINPYASTSPAEFFAVLSEYFFTAPDLLQQHFAEVYAQLRLYYRQDPLLRYQNSHNAHLNRHSLEV